MNMIWHNDILIYHDTMHGICQTFQTFSDRKSNRS